MLLGLRPKRVSGGISQNNKFSLTKLFGVFDPCDVGNGSSYITSKYGHHRH